MQEVIKTFPKISSSKFWSKLFINVANGNGPEEIKVTDNKFYYEDECVNMEKCKDIADFYNKVVKMLKKYITKEETWVNTKKNIKTDIILKYAEKKSRKYNFSRSRKEKLISTLNMILFLKNSKNLVVMKGDRIKKINGINFYEDKFTIDPLFCKSFQITKKGKKDIFTKQCNKFEKNMLRKINTYR